MNKIEVTLITPTFNSKKLFYETFNSVVNQTFSNWEWIIIDDCSSDGTFDFIKKLVKNEKRIILLKTDINCGTSAARNIGLKIANGKYITFLDSDDILDSDYLEKQICFIRIHGPLVTASYRRQTEQSCTDFCVPKIVDYKTALKGNPLSCLTTMYDRTVIGDVFFPEDIDKPEDYVFWLSMLKRGFVCIGNPEVLATYNIHSGSKSSNKLKLIPRMHHVYHKTQGINWFKSWFYVVRWAFYGKKKYKNVR